MYFSRILPEDRPLNPSIFQMMAGSATDESGRSSSQMSNESTTPRRDDSPASSCDSKEREVTMKVRLWERRAESHWFNFSKKNYVHKCFETVNNNKKQDQSHFSK